MNKIQFLKFLLSRLAWDTFTRSNGALGNAESGQAWGMYEGTIQVSSNKAKATSSGGSMAYISVSTANVEVSAEIVRSTSDNEVSIVARGSSSTSHIKLTALGSSIQLYRMITGTQVSLGSYSYSWTNGATHTLKLKCSGDDFTAYLDGSSIITATNSNALASNTGVGMHSYRAGNVPVSTFDNFEVK